MKEITEKSELMEKQLEEKEQSQSSIEQDMQLKITEQEEEIKKQIEVYSENTKVKREERDELQRVFVDYKDKYDSFVRALKKSRISFQAYEGEIKNLNVRINDLQKLKKDVTAGKKSKAKQPDG